MATETISSRRFERLGRTRLERIGSYDTYAEAQKAVDRLSDQRFPVETLTIVGEGLSMVENVTGRRGYGRAAGEGAIGGAIIAGFVGLLFGLLSWFDPLISGLLLGLYGLAFGAVVGALIGLVMHWATRGERDFSSVQSIRAERFDVLAAADVADDARERLAA
jgi:hypothetical protein